MRISLQHYLHARLRLIVSITAGLLCFFLLPAQLGLLQRLLIGWNVLAWLYLFFLWLRMLRTPNEDIPHIAKIEDESATLVLSMVTLTCLVSIVAILLDDHAKSTAWHPARAAPAADRRHAGRVMGAAAHLFCHALRPSSLLTSNG